MYCIIYFTMANWLLNCLIKLQIEQCVDIKLKVHFKKRWMLTFVTVWKVESLGKGKSARPTFTIVQKGESHEKGKSARPTFMIV